MKTQLLFRLALLLMLTCGVAAQVSIKPPEQTASPTPDSEWTVLRSQSQIEMLPTLRLLTDATKDSAGRRAIQVRRFTAHDANIDGQTQGVVFNHALRSYGSLTGEISFRVNQVALEQAESLAVSAGLSGVRRIARSDYFVVRAASPQQLRDALLRLRAQPGVLEAEWVVNYNLPRRQMDAARAAAR